MEFSELLHEHVLKMNPGRFFDYISPEPNTGCWIWTRSVDSGGYGRISLGRFLSGYRCPAHRVSWMLHNGPIQDGLVVCHKCDNRYCVNPLHLFVGSHIDNFNDMVRKARHSFYGPLQLK